MNRNELLRSKKEKSIKSAIKYLHNKGHIKFYKKLIAETTKELFPNDLDRQININTLSKIDYYKKNIDNWITEIVGTNREHLEKAREKSILTRKKSAQKNFKKLELEALRIVNLILLNEIKCENFTKKFLIEELAKRNIKGEYKVNYSTFSQEFYLPIYKKAMKNLYEGRIIDSNQNRNFNSEILTLQRENKRLKDVNAKLFKNLFVTNEEAVSKGCLTDENSKFSNIILDKKLLYSYVNLFEHKFEEEIKALTLFEDIVKYCKNKS